MIWKHCIVKHGYFFWICNRTPYSGMYGLLAENNYGLTRGQPVRKTTLQFFPSPCLFKKLSIYKRKVTVISIYLWQIRTCFGQAYVAGRGIVHRDLAARNILIGHDQTLKISDFGLSREGVYVKTTSGKIPLRWLSVESIRERRYSSASDV